MMKIKLSTTGAFNLTCICFIFVQIMKEMAKQPNIKGGCLKPNRLADLQALSEGLESCQKSLNDYLDSKRNAFPRFFFISDEELLTILGSGDPACVQEHMIKVLCGIQGVLLLFL